ncbi:hypothetical protein Cpap_0126 [Ruminiclostridium papyrosolvens DSM 2782]|uniref:Uncharacterized protein n=1 Tax=Ruminiclostridium papyrosolvens DSM 2782 TaxID=588581 RepID=F1TIE2_9FIRM|nr:hypothetical protein [Ruminiclostridium papyrosolvens]EGD45759.1 hypothetical protein Cpap_0126 [Ruminiclostridium papyrosolvens DSM 2782]WES33920.1 hypothetical protein P0092_19480 [Ruminiclostridium papyrosolvens DSM 2782]
MKASLKLFFVGILTASIILSSSSTFAQESNTVAVASDKEKIISKLLNAGFTSQQINDLPESELLTYKDGEIVSADTRYYRISRQREEKSTFHSKNVENNDSVEETSKVIDEGTSKVTELTKEQCLYEVQEYNKKNSQSQYVTNSPTGGTFTTMGIYDSGLDYETDTDGWITMNLLVTHVSGTKYKLSAQWTWLTVPDYTQTDVIGLGHDDGLTKTNDPIYSYFKDDWKNGWQSVSSGTDTNTTPEKSLNDSGGAVVSYKLYSHDSTVNGGYWRENYRGYMSYYVNVNDTSRRYVSVYAKYAHQQTTWAISPSISWPLSIGFSVQSSEKFDFMSPNPYCSVHVNY